jgi:hypothetical protein
MIVADVFNTTHRRAIISLAERHRVPAVYFSRYFATEGGLVIWSRHHRYLPAHGHVC